MSLFKTIKGMFKFAQLVTRKQNANSKPSKDKLKTKKFLEEDSKWTQLNDEEVISLMSFGSEDGDTSSIMPLQSTRARFCPLIFLGLFIITNICPVLVNCANDLQSVECIQHSANNLSPTFGMIYQIGNLTCSLLSIFIFCNIYALQKASGIYAIVKGCTTNLIIGSVGALLWMAYVMLETIPGQSFYRSLLDETILVLYFVCSLVYNFYNQMKLKARIEDHREKFGLKKLLLFFFKNILCFIILAAVLVYIALTLGQGILSSQSPQNIAVPIISGYVEIAKIIALLMTQSYVALYHIDINYVYEGGFAMGGSLSFDKKLDLNRL